MTIITGLDEKKDPNAVTLTAIIFTHPETSKKTIEIMSGGSPCGIPEEQWLPVQAYGSKVTGIYLFNGERVTRKQAHLSMRKYVEEYYAHLLK